jgi:hypothetical protein
LRKEGICGVGEIEKRRWSLIQQLLQAAKKVREILDK